MNFGVALRHMQKLFGEGSVSSLADARLLERFASSRDESAFAALVDRHGPMVLGVCRSVLKDAHHAEDAFQATFLVLAKKAPTIRAADTLAAWLYRVAFRIAIQANRESDRRKKREAKAMALRGERPDTEMLATLHEEIDRLPEKHRVPLVLCYLEGQSYEEAGKILQLPPATIRGRLVRAKEALSARLTRRGVTGTVAALALLTPATTRAAVPEAWAKSTVKAALGGSSSAAAVAWSSALMNAGTVATVAKVALVAAAMIGVGLVAFNRPDEPKTPANPPAPAAAPQVAKEVAKPDPKPAEMVEVKGRVVSPRR